MNAVEPLVTSPAPRHHLLQLANQQVTAIMIHGTQLRELILFSVRINYHYFLFNNFEWVVFGLTWLNLHKFADRYYYRLAAVGRGNSGRD
jgi:hypothetical protein